ncbi:MAG: L-seryl-tRNA(Sec) selenium transferase [Acidobacteriota bacterium]
MKDQATSSASGLLRDLPSVDELLRTVTAGSIAADVGTRFATVLARRAIEGVRAEVREAGSGSGGQQSLIEISESKLLDEYQNDRMPRIQRVINATGVVVHTNLGRAPLSANARRAIVDAAGYSSVEYDVAAGKRGKRGERAESLICELTGAEAAVIVNNCAAAAFLVLTVFAAGGEVVISRGELVEIGGDFRIPDVLVRSGATLREVGTTNRTSLADHEKAINEKTCLLLKVHPSNYRITGFSSAPSVSELAGLAHEKGLIFFEDAGSGALTDLSEYGITDEPIIADSIRAGADLVAFSGDKLLGGPQAGMIVGRSELIDQIRKHPLYRVLRVDKIAYAALEATLEAYRKGTSTQEIPVQRMLSLTRNDLAARTAKFVERLTNVELSVEIIDGHSVIGGGAAPDVQPATVLLAISHSDRSAERLEYALRNSTPAVIARIAEGRVVLDLRTVCEIEEGELLNILNAI